MCDHLMTILKKAFEGLYCRVFIVCGVACATTAAELETDSTGSIQASLIDVSASYRLCGQLKNHRRQASGSRGCRHAIAVGYDSVFQSRASGGRHDCGDIVVAAVAGRQAEHLL